ncbi:MAG: hypothetical protein NC483_03440 [Ruminococcus sp.]|nr:hypothetical protein [Ruminococcus sp.]
MKYTLCFDDYHHFNGKKRFTEIKGFLPEGDPYNLKDICNFTFQFENPLQFKNYLVSKGIINKRDLYETLVIMYYYRRIKVLRVPFAEDKPYFSKRVIIDYISREVRENMSIMDCYKTRQNLPDSFYELRYDPYSCDVLGEAGDFVDRMCTKSYKALFDFAMITSQLDKPRRDAEKAYSEERLTEVEQDEVLIRRRVLKDDQIEGQMSLF